jgi:hypothetical protein
MHEGRWARVYRGLAVLSTLQGHRFTKHDDDPTSLTSVGSEADLTWL